MSNNYIKNKKIFIFFLFMFNHSIGFTEEKDKKETLTISISDFCPYMCIDEKNVKGFAVDIVERVLNAHFEIKLIILPWARSVKEVSSGRIDAILASGKPEAPNLIYPKNPIGIQENCFYSPNNSTWTYHSKENLKLSNNMIITYIGWDGGKIMRDFLGAKYREKITELSYDQHYFRRATAMIAHERAIAFWSDPNVYSYNKNKQINEHNKYKKSGCISSFFLYLAFSPNNVEKSKRASKAFDDGYNSFKNSTFFKNIFKKYNVEDYTMKNEIKFH